MIETRRRAALWSLLPCVAMAAAPAQAAEEVQPPPHTEEATAAAPYRLRIEAPDDLADLLGTFLDLARFRTDPALAEATEAEVRRLIAATPAQARSLLETRGYFNPTIRIDREEGQPPLIRIEVDPGERTRVSRTTLEVQGEIVERAEAGHARDQALLQEIQDGWRLREGRPFSQDQWSAEKTELLGRLRRDGYPAASWAGTAAEVDAPRNTVRLFVVADSGPLFRFGPVRIEGLSKQREEAVSHQLTFGPGDRYTEKQVLDLQERLQRSGLFESASVLVDPNPASAQAAPVTIAVREAPLQDLTLGIGYSDVARERGTIEHLHRRPLGLNWVAKHKLEVGRDQRSLSSEWTSHPKADQYRNLLAFAGERFSSDRSAPTDSYRLRVGRTQDTERIDRLYYGEYTTAIVTTDLGRQRASALTANYEWIWRHVDDVLLPTRGIAASAQLGAGHARSDAGQGPFSRVYGRLSGYLPLGRWYASARIEGGEVFTPNNVEVPDTLRFRAGGDDSVRGYPSRSIGPQEGGETVGGNVLATASLELARPLGAGRLRSWWGAVFVDAGDATHHWSAFDAKLGWGLGLRWRSPVGPLKVDAAYGEATKRWRLHLSVGIAY
ncbi:MULTISPECIES: BamA/TamA family outer membrane protein [Caldimonas]|uniref:autotransporter assembly complex protein TamA n=1 Tax=Caldimonas TaxID=196013 RepID=UPI000378419F|nr:MULTISPECIES: BamA/TamA family outer membrane protein [Caldimonas]GIX23178.1 MAG: outer membrane protein assembly factor [Caldimonas sp.]